MNKLTAGIFAGILTIVTVNAARADIATTNYVNQNVDAKVGALSGLTTTEKNNTVAAINEVNKAAKDASTAATTAETNAKTYADDLNTAMNTRVTATESAITKLNGDAETEGSVDYKITQATMDTVSDLNTTMDAVEKLNGNAETAGSVDNKIKTAIDGLDGNVTGSGVVKTIEQENGVLTATLSAVAESDLDTELADKINGKMNTTDYNTATTMAADGTYAKKANTVGANLTALDTQVKANADAIGTANGKITANETAIADITKANGTIDTKIAAAKAEIKTTTDGLDERVTANTTSITTLNGADTVEGSVKKQIKDAIATVNTATGELSGRVTANEEAIEALQTDKANAANVYTKTEIDGKVSTINTEIGKKVTATNLQNKLLTTTAAGQLQDASTGLTKPSDCGKNGVTCMLVNDGTGFKWEKIVDTYAAN